MGHWSGYKPSAVSWGFLAKMTSTDLVFYREIITVTGIRFAHSKPFAVKVKLKYDGHKMKSYEYCSPRCKSAGWQNTGGLCDVLCDITPRC